MCIRLSSKSNEIDHDVLDEDRMKEEYILLYVVKPFAPSIRDRLFAILHNDMHQPIQ